MKVRMCSDQTVMKSVWPSIKFDEWSLNLRTVLWICVKADFSDARPNDERSRILKNTAETLTNTLVPYRKLSIPQ